jgi:hypothetical protein
MLAITVLLSMFLTVVAITDLLRPKLFAIITFRHGCNTDYKNHIYKQQYHGCTACYAIKAIK